MILIIWAVESIKELVKIHIPQLQDIHGNSEGEA